MGREDLAGENDRQEVVVGQVSADFGPVPRLRRNRFTERSICLPEFDQSTDAFVTSSIEASA